MNKPYLCRCGNDTFKIDKYMAHHRKKRVYKLIEIWCTCLKCGLENNIDLSGAKEQLEVIKQVNE